MDEVPGGGMGRELSGGLEGVPAAVLGWVPGWLPGWLPSWVPVEGMAGVADPRTAVVLASALLVVAILLWGPASPFRPDIRVPFDRARGADSAGRRRRVTARPGPSAGSDVPPTTEEEVASAMVLLSVALQSGCGVVEAVEHVAGVGGDAAARQLAVVAAAWRWGVGEGPAWSEVDPAWARTALALRLAARAGVAPSSLLLDGADDLRAGRLAAVDAAAARVAVRLVVPLGVAFLPAFVLTTVVPVVLALTRQVLAP